MGLVPLKEVAQTFVAKGTEADWADFRQRNSPHAPEAFRVIHNYHGRPGFQGCVKHMPTTGEISGICGF